jgi:prepilin-type N-terminal cleavage/methylation domain-containing protein
LAIGDWRCHAFTLIEIMVAIAIFTLVVGAIYSAWMLLIRSTQISKDVAAQAQRQRIALRTIEDSLMSVQSFQASPQYYSFAVENGDTAKLSFVSRVPDIFPRNGKFINPNTGREFNLRRLTFALQAGENGQKDLVLRQNPVLMDLDEDEQNYPLMLARNVRKFTIECWDTNKMEWADEWDDTNSIPTMMRIGLAMGGNTDVGKDAPEFAVTRLLSLPSQMMPAAAQNGSGGNPGGPGGGPQLQIPNPTTRGRPNR